MSLRMRSLVVAGVIGMVFAALGVGVVLAEGGGDDGERDRSATADETKQERMEEFRAALAEELGVTAEALEAAFRQVALDRVDDALEAGTITEEQAEALRTAIDSGEWRGKRRGGGAFRHGGFAEGTSLEELKADWKQAALDRFDAAVEAGKISEEQADAWRTAIESGERPEREDGFRGRHGGFKGRWGQH